MCHCFSSRFSVPGSQNRNCLLFYFFFFPPDFFAWPFLAAAFLCAAFLCAGAACLASAFSWPSSAAGLAFLGLGSFTGVSTSGAVNFCPSKAISVVRTWVKGWRCPCSFLYCFLRL